MDQPLHMWSYWKDDKGRMRALEEYFPSLAKTNPVIAAAIGQIKVAERAIDAEMRELREKELDAEEASGT